jgi:hypothetical protein
MTDDEKRMAIALTGCTFVPGIATKRFARQVAYRAEQGTGDPLTEKQAKYLRDAVIRFRRQIDPAIVALARQSA